MISKIKQYPIPDFQHKRNNSMTRTFLIVIILVTVTIIGNDNIFANNKSDTEKPSYEVEVLLKDTHGKQI